ncbi:MAG TPA: response regulator transcription factor, partial [Anaerolineales bacterium]|nr:response regulator transcription factor [Anaerolineales bacterium]
MAEYGEPLSERELEVLNLVATGASNKEVAHRLHISVNTVKVHLRNIFTKLGAESRTEATMIAVREGWVVVPEVRPTPTPAPEP